MNFKKASQCDSLEELRGEIDKIDYEIIQLLSERMKYVEAVVDFKSNEEHYCIRAKRTGSKRACGMGLEKWSGSGGVSEDLFHAYRK